jgi:hypothetical protein
MFSVSREKKSDWQRLKVSLTGEKRERHKKLALSRQKRYLQRIKEEENGIPFNPTVVRNSPQQNIDEWIDEPGEMTVDELDQLAKEYVGQPPAVMVDNYEALTLSKIVECLKSRSTRLFYRMPHLMFVEGEEDGELAAVACNPKEARTLLKTHLENSVMNRLSDDQVGPRLEVTGRPTKLATPKQSDAQYVSVVCDMPALDHVPEPFDISEKKRSRLRKIPKDRHVPVSLRTKVSIPAKNADSYSYEIQMAVPIPVCLDENDNEEAVRLVSPKCDDVVQVRLFPYVMSVVFGSMQDTVTIPDVDDQFRKFTREACHLPTTLGQTDCKIAFPSRTFGRTVFFELGTWKDVEAYEPLAKRKPLKMPPASTVTQMIRNVRHNLDNDVRAEDTLVGGVARFVSACYPELYSSVVESMPMRITEKKIKSVKEKLSSVDVRNEYESIIQAKEVTLQAKDDALQDAIAVSQHQNKLIVELRRKVINLLSANLALKKGPCNEHDDEVKKDLHFHRCKRRRLSSPYP